MKIIVDEDIFVKFINQWLNSVVRQLTICCCAIAIACILSGCVKYETGINFYSLNDGEIIEQIQLGEQLNSLSHNAVGAWLASIEQRTKQAQGRIERMSDRELKVIIPFHNTRQLATKLNRYFNPNLPNTVALQPSPSTVKSQFNSQLRIDQNNFFLAVRNHLVYDLDLRSLVVMSDAKTSIASINPVNLNFSLQSPWGVRSSDRVDEIAGVKNPNKRQISWHLQPGKLNHLEAIFWLPDPLGIGAILIILLSTGSYYLKYRQLPLQPLSK